MTIWNGRFRTRLDRGALDFSSSLKFDRRLYAEDIEGSLAHVRMLAKQGIIPRRQADRIARGLKRIRHDIDAGKVRFDGGGGRFTGEDVHMAIESLLISRIGEAGGMLHTGRSRNDQVSLDERLWMRKAIGMITKLIGDAQRALLAQGRKHSGTLMSGYTHLQRAQPILLAHHLLSWISMLDRDRERFGDALNRVNRSPLGAGALAGTSFPIDRKAAARALGFDSIIENSIDAVSDRDVQIEFLFCCAITMMHLSRFAEELVLWSSEEWSFAGIGDAWSTGSSIMPQKKNPDMAELIRGKTGRVYGNAIALLTVMKGLPLAYNRDMQEDKEPLFDSADTVSACLRIFASMMKTVRFNVKRFETGSDSILATDLADFLVRKGMSFRKAHSVVGGIVRECLAKKTSLRDLPIASYRRHSALFDSGLKALLSFRGSVNSKRSAGSTSPREVERSIRNWTKRLR